MRLVELTQFGSGCEGALGEKKREREQVAGETEQGDSVILLCTVEFILLAVESATAMLVSNYPQVRHGR